MGSLRPITVAGARSLALGSGTLGTLPLATLLAYLGLVTRADGTGLLIWRLATLAAAIVPFSILSRRQRELERIGAELCTAGLLRLIGCGCAELPRMVRDLARSRAATSYNRSCPTRRNPLPLDLTSGQNLG